MGMPPPLRKFVFSPVSPPCAFIYDKPCGTSPHRVVTIFVYYKKIMVIFGFTIAVNRESSNEIPILTLSFQGIAYLVGGLIYIFYVDRYYRTLKNQAV